MRKKSIAFLLVLVMALSIFAMVGCQDTNNAATEAPAATTTSAGGAEETSGDEAAAADADVVKIGTPTYLTGTNSFTGNESVYGIQLAISEKETLWGKPIEFIPADGVDNSKMPSAAEYLLDVEDVRLFIMGSNSVPGAMQSVIQPKGGFQIEATNWAPEVLDGGWENHIQNPLMYNVFADEGVPMMLDELAPLIGKNRDTVRIGVMTVNFWQPIANAVEKALKDNNCEPVFFENYSDDISDFTALIAKMKAAEVDILFHTARPSDAALFLKQSLVQKYRPAIILGNGLAYDQPEFAELGEAGVGCLSLSWPSPSMNDEKMPVLQEFKENYKALHNRDPLTHSMVAYSTAKIALDAFENAGEMDNAKIKQAFMELDIPEYEYPNVWGFKAKQDEGKSAYNERATMLLLNQWLPADDGGIAYRAVGPAEVSVAEMQIPYPWFD